MLWGHFFSGLSSGLTVAGAVEQGGLLEDMHGCMLSRFSHVQLFEIPWTVAYRALSLVPPGKPPYTPKHIKSSSLRDSSSSNPTASANHH